MTHVLPDVLAPNLRVIFCGTAAGRKSAEIRAYYAGRGNRFWRTLNAIGLTPTVLSPFQFEQILPLGIGLTDVAKRTFGADSALSKSDFDGESVRQKVLQFSPLVLAFNGKRAARQFYGYRADYGRQPNPVGKTAVFVLPSTSGAASGFWDEGRWHDLAAFIMQRSP